MIDSVLIILGLLLIYTGCLVYPHERKKLHNLLEDLWVVTAQKEENYRLRVNYLLGFVIGYFVGLYNKLFGEKLISERSVMTSVVLSAWFSPFFGIYLLIVIFALFAVGDSFSAIAMAFCILLVTTVFIGVWLVHIVKRVTDEKFIRAYKKNYFSYVGYLAIFWLSVPTAFFFCFLFMLDVTDSTPVVYLSIMVFVLMAISVSCDIGSIFITRKFLQNALHADSIIMIMLWFVFDIFLALVLGSIPIIFLVVGYSDYLVVFSPYLKSIGISGIFLNLTVLLPTIVYLAVIIVLLVNMLFWNSILRPVYSMIDVKIFEKRKSLIGLGVFCLSVSFFDKYEIGIIKAIIGHF